MQERSASKRPKMSYLQMDMLHMDFPDAHFQVALDKGTLDAVLTDDEEVTLSKVDRMFAEISRVLQVGGRYLCVSLAQAHVLKKAVEYFSQEGWVVRVHEVATSGDKQQFVLPVFVYVMTKFRKIPGSALQILEMCPEEQDKPLRLESTERLVEAVKDRQHYALLCSQLSKAPCGEQLSLDLCDKGSGRPRYTLHVVDSPAVKPSRDNRFAIFISEYSLSCLQRDSTPGAAIAAVVLACWNWRWRRKSSVPVGFGWGFTPRDLSSSARSTVSFLCTCRAWGSAQTTDEFGGCWTPLYHEMWPLQEPAQFEKRPFDHWLCSLTLGIRLCHAVLPPCEISVPYSSSPGWLCRGQHLPGALLTAAPICSPAGQRNRVALWDGGRAEAAGCQRGLWAPGHCGPAQGAALRGHGEHPGRAVGEGDGAGPAGPPRPAAGEPAHWAFP